MTLTVITPTGERPEAFALCQCMMARQTYKGKVRWLIVDDGEEPQEITINKPNIKVAVLRPEPFWKLGDNTQGRNLKAALELVDDSREVVTIWEDDDFYGPGWLQFIVDNIHKAELIGEHGAVYYNVRERNWGAINNDSHACLRCSAMRGNALKTFRNVLAQPNLYYDLQLWKRHGDRRTFPRKHTVGVKGMPGRQGIAQGHDGLKGTPDPSLNKLYEMIGDEAGQYAEFYHETGKYRDQLFCRKQMHHSGRDFSEGDEFTGSMNRLHKEIYIAAGFLVRKTIRQTGEKHAYTT